MSSSSSSNQGGRVSGMVIQPALFGDAFGTRGDYSKGIFYAGRRKYLSSPEPTTSSSSLNPLKPPDYFLSREQVRHQNLKSNGVRLFQKLDFKKDEDAASKSLTRQQEQFVRAKSLRSRRQTSIVLRKYNGIEASDWKQEFQAGVHFWVNRVTGEVSSDFPSISGLAGGEGEGSYSHIKSKEKEVEEKEDGEKEDAASIENKELAQIFDLLDSMKSPKSSVKKK